MNKTKKTTILSIGTNKGGAGKTTICGNLGYALRDKGLKVLLIDTDAQMNLSQSFFDDEDLRRHEGKDFYNAFINKGNIEEYIIPTKYENLDFILGAVELARLDTEIVSIFGNDKRVTQILEPLVKKGAYDFILIDQNTSLSLLNKSILGASDEVLIPVEPSYFGVKGIALYLEHFNVVKEEYSQVNILGILFNKIDRRENISSDAWYVVESAFGDKALKSSIPVDAKIKSAQWDENPRPVALYDKYTSSVKAFNALAEEVLNIVKNR